MTIIRALLIGVKYTQSAKEELSGTHLDVDRVKAFLLSRGFPPESIFVMKDVDSLPQEQQPTRDNIMKAVKHLVASPWDPSDRRFFYFSGHGGQVLDTTHNERDGFDEVIFAAPSPSLSRTSTANLPPSFRVVNALLLPSYKVAIAVPKVTTEFPSTAPPVIPVNAILDDELHEHLVAPVPEGCKLIALVDACHSGSVLDLPFQYSIMSRSGRPKHRGPAASAEHYITNARGAVVRAHQRLSQSTLDRIPLTRALRWGVKRTGDVIEFVGKVLESRPAIAVFDATEALWAQKDVYLRSAMEDEHTSCGTRNHLKCLKEAEEKRVSKGNVILISGCNDESFSEESELNGARAGVLTWAVLKTIDEAEPAPLTMLKLMKQVRKKCATKDFMQKPQLSTGHRVHIKNHLFII